MRYLVLLLLLFCLEGKAQSYSFTLNECRVEATTGELRESFLVDRIRYFDRGDQTFIFDHESVLSVFDANITNYGRDSLKALIDIWIDSCNVVPIPTPPAPTALFANTTSLDLDGSSEYVTVANPADSSLSFGDGTTDSPFTVSAWIYPATTTGGVQIISGKGGTNFEFLAVVNDNDFELRLYDLTGGNRTYAISGNTLTNVNTWQHLTWTYDGSGLNTGITICLNGIDVTTGVGSVGSYTAMHTTAEPFTIGAYGAGLSPFDGKIDQPTIFNKELSIEEVKELMALRDYSYFSDTASIVSSWYMDAPDDLGVADGVTDRFGSNDGTGVNTTTADNLVECIEYPYDYQLDSSSLYTNLTPMQNDSADAFGGFGIDLNGTDEYILTNDSPLLSFTNDTVYMGAWISMDDATSFPIIEKTDEYLFWVNASDILEVRFIDQSTGGYIGRTYNTALTGWEGQWIYVEALLFGNTSASIDLRLNGALVDDTDANSGSYTAMEDRATSLLIGNSGAAYADGRIGDIWISNDRNNEYNEHQPTDLTLLGDDLAVYYRGYNSTNTASGVLDQSGNGLNGIPTNTDLSDFQYDSPRSIFEADSSASFSFDGSTEYVTVPDTDSLTMTTLAGTADTSFSISIWANFTDVTSAGLLGKFESASGSNNAEWGIYVNASDQLIFGLFDNSFSNRLLKNTGSIAVYEGVYTNWIFTYNGDGTLGGMNIYINTTIPSGGTSTAGTYVAMENTPAITTLGGVTTAGSPFLMDGNQAHITIMKGIELDLCQIQEIYNDGSPQDPRDWTFYQPNFIHWRMNSGDDPATSGGVLDIIGNINGSGVNAPTLDTESYPTN